MFRCFKSLIVVTTQLFCLMSTFPGIAGPAVTLGEKQSLRSKVLNKEVPLSVHLPENYNVANKSYPVIYMLGSHYGARFAMLASTLDYMADSHIPAMILIGIDLPEGNKMLLPDSETGDTTIPDKYMDFMEKELIPFVDNKYRTVPFRSLYGASNSGFFSTYTLLRKPEVFHSYFASSPSIGAAPELLKKCIALGPMKEFSGKRFFHIVYSDDDFDDVTGYVPGFSNELIANKPEGLSYKVDVLVNQGHVPAVDFITFLTSLYPDFNPPEQVDELNKIKQHFALLSERYGYQVNPPLAVLYEIGRSQALEKRFTEAEGVFNYILQIYPENKKTYLGMGILRREQGDIESAKLMFEKALAIDPDYSTAKRLLNKLGK